MTTIATEDSGVRTAGYGTGEAAGARIHTENEYALEFSERKYRRLFETAKDGILILDGDTGLVVDVNPFLTELTGYSHAHFLGKHLWEIYALKDIAASKDAFADLQSQTYVRHEDLPLKSRDGREIDVEFVSSVYRVDRQNMMQCNIRDVAARRRAERRTLEQHASLTAIFESTAFPIYAVDRQYHYTAFNQAHAVEMKATYFVDIQIGGLFGACQASRETWRAAKETLDRSLHGDTIEECAALGDEGHCSRQIETSYYPVRSAAGEVIGVAVFVRDVTVRKHEEDELRFKNLILSTQLDTSIDGIQVVDVFGRTISSNRRFAAMWGIPLDIIESESDACILQSMLDQLIDPDEFDHLRRQLSSVPDEETRDDIGLKDGRTFDCYSAPMLNKEAEHLGRVWQFRDITARRRAEKEREQLEEQLRMSQKLEAIGSLAGGIAHDFNNMLSVILSYTSFVKDGLREGDPVLNDLLEVQKAAERAADLTRSLLAFSRKQVLQPVTLSLNGIVSGLEKILRCILGENIEFCQELAPNLGLTRADPNQIEQVVMNLVLNARDAMLDGGKLTIETTNVELDEDCVSNHSSMVPGPYVALAISDTGCGMDELTKSRIFEPFFTTKEKGKGTGLGLSTVFGVVKQSGGHIWVESAPGQGTTIKLHLPRHNSGSIPAPSNLATVPRRGKGTETILVVEDEQALLKVATRTLEAGGYRVLTAASGEEALLIAEGHVGDIHLLLTDVVMPGINGKMLAQELTKTRPTLELLYMSGYPDSALGQRGVLERGTHFIAKPFIAADLARKVRTVLDGGSAGPDRGHERADPADAWSQPLRAAGAASPKVTQTGPAIASSSK